MSSTVNDWDLNKSNDAKYDLIIACNVFQYSPIPEVLEDSGLPNVSFMVGALVLVGAASLRRRIH